MFTSQATIERRAAKEKRLGGIEERLISLENAGSSAAIDLSPIEARLSSLESVKPVDLSSIETRLTTLEGRPAPVVDFSPLTDRINALEAVKQVDLSEIETRLVALETTLKTLTGADIRKRLDSAEAIASTLRKELDDMKALKKVTSASGFTTAAGSASSGAKNFAFPAKKKEDSSDKKREDSTD